MKRHSKYRALLEPFLAKPSFTAHEAVQAGIPHQALSYFTKQGVIERVSYGHYRGLSQDLGEEAFFEDLAVTAATIPNGIICLVSALKYYDLTEEIMRMYWIAVPHAQGAPVRPHVRIVRMRNVTTGRQGAKIAGVNVQIFNPERCIVDAFRYLSREIAMKALKSYLLGGVYKSDIPKLTRYAKTLRVNLDPFIAAIIT